jgi:methionine-rich copper-binding protein CopC
VFWLLGLLALAPGRAGAEGVLISTQPAEGALVEQFDGKVRLWFSGNVSERAPTLIVVDAAGNRVDNGDMRLDIGEHSELSATTRPLPAGAYVVRYRVLTRDGLVVSGIRRFSVRS